jgi:hypothetical protein
MKVFHTDDFEEWFCNLSPKHQEATDRIIQLLEINGVRLGFPYSSGIEGCKYAFRELRIHSGSHAIRVIYAFDPNRDALLILGGDKTGKKEKRFYKRLISQCEALWERYLLELKK